MGQERGVQVSAGGLDFHERCSDVLVRSGGAYAWSDVGVVEQAEAREKLRRKEAWSVG